MNPQIMIKLIRNVIPPQIDNEQKLKAYLFYIKNQFPTPSTFSDAKFVVVINIDTHPNYNQQFKIIPIKINSTQF